MAITKEKKSAIVEKLKFIADKGKTIVFVNFHGLSVEGVNDLRKNLRLKEVGYYVAKKTLIKRTLGEANFDGEMPELEGEIALSYLTNEEGDTLLPIKEIYDFQKKNAEVIKIVGGIYNGSFVDADFVIQMAKIPNRETLYAQFVNLINSPIQGLVMALDQIAQKKETA
ncbi:MAG: 50S ribosomal protein L10 [Candidatus Paceibacterota bacterium]|jgi:large subunit ribosomal protein L10